MYIGLLTVADIVLATDTMRAVRGVRRHPRLMLMLISDGIGILQHNATQRKGRRREEEWCVAMDIEAKSH